MTRRCLHNLLFGLVTVVNGAVMLIGPGLHGLPGCGHGAVASRPVGPADDAPRVVSGGGASATICPVCEYLAQGQVVAERALIARPILSATSGPVLPSTPPELRAARALGCRAPPALERL
jgi:hypothetical protein